MQTSVIPSRFDGKPQFQLYYSPYRNPCAWVNVVDELRTLHNGLYLGIGTSGFTEGMRMYRMPFCLAGPIVPIQQPDRDEE